jgi:SNF2 family DNA or RNA helicase
MKVALEIEGKRIGVRFPYDENKVAKMKNVNGRKFTRAGGPHWTVPLDMQVCRELRNAFGSELTVGPQLRAWALEAKRAETALGSISAAGSGLLRRLPDVLPELYRAVYLGPLYKNAKMAPPLGLGYSDDDIDAMANLMALLTGTEAWDPANGSYQTADIRFMADSPAPGNFNHQGLGKTIELIGYVWEAGLEEGCHLVTCPSAAIEGVWLTDLMRWQADAPCEVSIYALTGTRAQREAMLNEFKHDPTPVKWVVVNPEMLRWRKLDVKKVDGKYVSTSKHAVRAKPKDAKKACQCGAIKDAHWHYETTYPDLANVVWRTVTLDEAHKGGQVRNHRSVSARSINDLFVAKDGRRAVLTGTPMKEFGADIWGLLHFLRPEVFTSFWRFAQQFFDVDTGGFGWTVGKLREESEAGFYALLAQYALRRLKSEVAPWLPDKQHIDVWVDLTGKQLKQYASMEAEALVDMPEADTKVAATSILAEFTRLTQFARTLCTVEGGKVVPTRDSAKLDALWAKLREAGILSGTSDDQTVIFSESREMIDLVTEMLDDEGVSVRKLSGATTKQGYRTEFVEDFQAGRFKVACIVTTAGGTSLTLDAADTAHFLDEPWSPDESEQAQDRIHRTSRVHQVTIYHYIARDTIDEYRLEVAADKRTEHERILDLRRRMLSKDS